jgi:ABC-type ATPase involved in cell division
LAKELDARFRGHERSLGRDRAMSDGLPLSNQPQPLPLLDIKDLTVEFSTRRGIVKAVKNVDLSVAKGETVGIVGESGSGKSVTSFAVMRILDRAGRIAEGAVTFSGLDVRAATDEAMRDLRGREMSMIFQNPRAALNPIRKVGVQIEDVLRQHAQADSTALTDKAIEMLDAVRIARPRERYHAYLIGRHVPARRHRAGACLQAATADRRRTDHRPRCHDAEDRDGPCHGADAPARHVDDPHHT